MGSCNYLHYKFGVSALDSNTDDYVSDEARSIDEMMFYYVDKNQLNLPRLEFAQLLQNELN